MKTDYWLETSGFGIRYFKNSELDVQNYQRLITCPELHQDFGASIVDLSQSAQMVGMQVVGFINNYELQDPNTLCLLIEHVSTQAFIGIMATTNVVTEESVENMVSIIVLPEHAEAVVQAELPQHCLSLLHNWYPEKIFVTQMNSLSDTTQYVMKSLPTTPGKTTFINGIAVDLLNLK